MISIVFDCGATNVRAVAINEEGEIVRSKSFPNNTQADPGYPQYLIWDVYEIWDKMCMACREVVKDIDPAEIAGVTVTTFGVDGAPVDRSGKLLYPMISWQCERTVQVMKEIDRYMPLEKIYSESAVQPFNFNTINKIVWLKENHPGILEKAHRFLFAPAIFGMFLSGEMANGITMAGTSMMTAKRNRDFSDNILSSLGVSRNLFGPLSEPGEISGKISSEASQRTGLPRGLPVVISGHDTQFAIFGSGAGINQPVLSSGTWEILMVRSETFLSGPEQLKNKITTELDPIKGYYNIGNQWIASGMLEWAGRNFFHDLGSNPYKEMIEMAEKVPPGSKGVRIIPAFYEESEGKGGGQISGLTMGTTRYEIYRAMLESLALKLREGKKAIEEAGGFRSDSILCVGGGSKNRLWNQLRADIAEVEIKVIDKKETTVLGASLFVQSACGLAKSPDEARRKINYKTEVFKPSENALIYRNLFEY
ncbi:MAG: L-fuculokinase [Marinilabiliaceae bacterium]|jgi:L-fuculokinase|nr:L-fuculokinase [Marinilabiliaceae bacterium]